MNKDEIIGFAYITAVNNSPVIVSNKEQIPLKEETAMICPVNEKSVEEISDRGYVNEDEVSKDGFIS